MIARQKFGVFPVLCVFRPTAQVEIQDVVKSLQILLVAPPILGTPTTRNVAKPVDMLSRLTKTPIFSGKFQNNIPYRYLIKP